VFIILLSFYTDLRHLLVLRRRIGGKEVNPATARPTSWSTSNSPEDGKCSICQNIRMASTYDMAKP
jgi:hypothetical protein